MQITRLILKNWRNFKQADIPLDSRTYLIGANASGKSNLLDVFRFFRDICKASGGGLQKAIADRGGITRLRCLQARQDTEVRLEIHLSEHPNDPVATWQYALAFKAEGKGAQRILLTEERVHHRGQEILCRPDPADASDTLRLTQTHLEQINNNQQFRAIAEHFQDLTYLHLVPQLLKHAREINGHFLEDDPFGQGLLQRIACTPKNTRDARLKRTQQVLALAVSQFSELRFCKDEVSGLPHLEACYQHWRPNGAWQREDQFSDGTLRLIGLLWALQEGNGLLLLEEPELSLNDAIVGQIPLMIDRILRKRKLNRQVIISTHSETLLAGLGSADQVLLLEPTKDGTRIRPANEEEKQLLDAGLNPAEVLLPKTRLANMDQLGLL
ncbi:AAA family ATPase [Azotobacter chroococcum]|uniref:AAA family ATPase n=1 Tax=Azotobacter chroococcum TaxID=353 RepID=A0AA44C801_9GAMM|nr:ATP-binding protein [Azotobacter chroococcum]NHN79070.1 AAA family ATPase [Azotobacter chroococcum]